MPEQARIRCHRGFALASLALGLALTLGFALAAAAQARPQASAARAPRRHVYHCNKAKTPHKHRVINVGIYDGKYGLCETIQDAINIAEPGNWILIGPGDYKQTETQEIPGASYGDGDAVAGADILVTTPDLHIRGMNRNTVMIDGTKPGYPECGSEEAAQIFGPEEEGAWRGNNGIVVYKVPGVWLENLSTCNFLGSNHGGDSVWFDGGGSSGKQEIGSWWGIDLSSTSTYWGGTEKPSDEYGIYASNTYGPGVFNDTYANNMADSGIYIGACPDCNTTVNNSKFEGNDLGYSGSNSGGHLVIENSEFNDNEEGFATQSQNNDDQPAPQEGLCPEGKENPSPPSGAQRKNICWVLIHNRIVENNNGGTPTSDGAPGLLGTGVSIAGGRNDLVAENLFKGNKAWGILILPYPGIEEYPPPEVVAAYPEDECRGGVGKDVEGHHECLYEPWASEVEGNTFAENGGYKNLSNGDIGEVATAEPKQLINCWHGNVEEGGGEPTSEPKLIQTTHGTCSDPDTGGEPITSPLGAEALCDSGIEGYCPGAPGEEYPRTEVKLMPLSRMAEESPTMANPCEGVPHNGWCPKAAVAASAAGRARRTRAG
jgi:hypothetical protein